MSHWSFIAAAYAVALIGVAWLLGWSFLTMRRAEAAADDLKRGQ